MSRAFLRFPTLLGAALFLGASPAAAVSLEDLIPLEPSERLRISARDVVANAFDNLYGCDLAQEVVMVTRTENGVTREQRVNMLRKRIKNRAHQLMDYRTTNQFYGLRLLKIEGHGRSDDHFMWVPELQRIRRFTSAQSGDLVQGTDLSFEDLEFRRIEEFAVVGRDLRELDGEWVEQVTIEPLDESPYERADLFIEPRDWVIREVHYYRTGSLTPFKTIRAPREEMNRFEDRVLPGRWIVTDYERRTQTDVIFRKTLVDPALADHLFSTVVLEKKAALPGVRK